MHVVCVHADGRADLREMPSERHCASGSIEAVRAAADLIAGKGNWEAQPKIVAICLDCGQRFPAESMLCTRCKSSNVTEVAV